ncbi:hypothetical protein D3C84_1123420 [compost metagenome]
MGDPNPLLIELLLISLEQLRSLVFCTEQLAQLPQVTLQRRQIRPGREQFDLHARRANLRQHRRWPHFFGADQNLRA